MAGRFDAIIVGLGPAGAAAGVALAQGGARVLALAGRPQRAKPCGGCLSARSLDSLAWLEPPAWLREHPVSQLWLTSPGLPPGRFNTDPPGAFFLPRRRWDAWLQEKAAACGVEVVHRPAREVERYKTGWRVKDGRSAWRAKWLLGADGAASLVGRRLGLGRTGFFYRALVEERPLTPRLAQVMPGAALLELGGPISGYGWIFVRGGWLNLGLAQRGEPRTAALLANFSRFLARHGLDPPQRWRGAVIPCPDGRRPRLRAGRALVVGDAAGLADPFLGEGIGQGMHSGRLAAEAVLAGRPQDYPRLLRRGLLREHWHARQIAHLVYAWPSFFQRVAVNHPGALEMGWQLLRDQVAYHGLWGKVSKAWLRRLLLLDRRQRA